jgi:NADH-quinone oxidoreductase subunit C
MNPEAIRDMLAEKLGIEVEWQAGEPGDPFCVVPESKWFEACMMARQDDALSFDFLRAQTGIDYPDDEQIEVVCHLFSYRHRHALVLKTRVDRKDPRLATVEDIWPAANWYEREIYDLLGVDFDGHSDLRRLVLPEDWVGHPLRKDYKEEDSYQGIPTVREGYPKFEPGGKKKKKKDRKPKEDKAEAKEPAAPKQEEPKAEEPKAEESKAEEPKAEEPKAEETKTEEAQPEEKPAEAPKPGDEKPDGEGE